MSMDVAELLTGERLTALSKLRGEMADTSAFEAAEPRRDGLVLWTSAWVYAFDDTARRLVAVPRHP